MVTESNESTAHGRKRKPDAANGNKGANDILDFYYYFTKEKNFSLICWIIQDNNDALSTT